MDKAEPFQRRMASHRKAVMASLEYSIISGPTRYDLAVALTFWNKRSGKQYVWFQLSEPFNSDDELQVDITTVTALDKMYGSWTFEGFEYKTGALAKGTYSTHTREGRVTITPKPEVQGLAA